jgi:'Cold-shock' DNA-binding domain
MQGNVKRIHDAGFCFIEPSDDSPSDIFAHFKDVGSSVQDLARLLKGTPGGGFDVIPEMRSWLWRRDPGIGRSYGRERCAHCSRA